MQLPPDEIEAVLQDFDHSDMSIAAYLAVLKNCGHDQERITAISKVLQQKRGGSTDTPRAIDPIQEQREFPITSLTCVTPGTSLVLIRSPEATLSAVQRFEKWAGCKVIIIHDAARIETFTDQQLAAIGLQRIPDDPDPDRETIAMPGAA